MAFLHIYIFDEKLYLQKSHKQATPQRNISILLWHWPFGRSYSLDGDKCLEMYNIRGCYLTDDTSAFPTADVVVFHHKELTRGLSSVLPLHLDRPASQRWAWLSMEPPINNANLTQLNGFFNLTMSYRRDADISIPYGKTVLGGDELGFKAATNHSCLVSWVVSRYRPHQARTGVYQSLKKYIPIEVYGKWNKKPLSNKKLLPTIANCIFYLSFENSETKDYISEKLWRNAFQSGAVPVVLGPSRATYEALAPPGSFIHVADFNSTADLAAYLKRVALDRQAYESYFQWHHTHRIKTYTDWRERLCQICVRYPSLPAHRVYRDLESWVNT
ncbi:alpha-(1,3)-fucosyltransferase 7-like isoform X2 [Anoplopoma fimbria]|uniref:alpha-(1,3)-fucosyltransferase 7-like isoform X2 n=1 Tax=Anoplopoma fimbria TaxID=229290 RepID=UPI0023EB2FE8|nr:alpha-(1,3)-fucosyltransferase 7-like isoform X2 [Anoplopoma fimbria]